ncbi:MAG: outer membrane lipoprotein carrier protein LolA [Prevotellaceae bacterium]|jgi:outer membrane lipoprotein-sorting protein|nr:outer membrane lipoprotein carrier protein LolA [Prevotellaceae bacterium]
MKKVLAISLLLISSATMFAQNMSTKKLVKTFSQQMQEYKALEVHFSYVLNNTAENIHDSQIGKALMSNGMYRLDIGSSVIYSNGATRWTYIKNANEVSISTPNPIEDGILGNPTALFIIDENDYKYKLLTEITAKDVTKVEVELTPKDATKTPYKSIILGLNKATAAPISIKYFGTDGNNLNIAIAKFNANVKPSTNDFVFDITKYPGVEVVDMR